MKVILLNQYYAPDEAATAQLLGDLGRGLAAAGHEVRAICGDRGYADPSRRYPRRETIGGVTVERVRSTPFGRTSKIGRVLDYATFLTGAALRLLSGPRPDVVISLTTPPMIALVGSLAARLRGAKSIFWSMDVYPDVAYELGAIRRESLAGRLFGWLSRLTLRVADVVVALGETMGARLEAAGAKRVEVVHNWSPDLDCGLRIADCGSGVGADRPVSAGYDVQDERRNGEGGSQGTPHPAFGHLLPAAAGRRGAGGEAAAEEGRRGARGDAAAEEGRRGETRELVVMYSGNLGLAHEFETLLQAAKRFCDSADVAVRFVFVGAGPRLREVRERAEELGLTNVEFRPPVAREELGASLCAAGLHLVTLRDRMPGLLVPSKIYGILSAGRPTLYIGPREGEVFDIVTSGACGTAVAIGDVEGAVEAIAAYASSPEKCAEEGRRARAMFEERFTEEKGVGRWVEILEDLAI